MSDRDYLGAVRGARRRLRRRHGRDPGGVRPHAGGLRRPRRQVPRGAGAQPPRRDRGRPHLDARGRRRGARDRHLPGQPPEARRVGARASTRSRSTPRPRRSRARPRAPDRFVAGSIGPTGFLPASDDPTLGDISFGRLVEVFDEQAGALIEGGADLLIIETQQDILETKAAIFGAREAFKRARAQRPDPGEHVHPQGVGRHAARHRPPLADDDPERARCRRARASTARPAPRTCATRSATSARTRRCRCTASPTPASPTRAPTARRSSRPSPGRWPTPSASTSRASASASSAAAAAPRPSTSRRSASASGPTASPPTVRQPVR